MQNLTLAEYLLQYGTLWAVLSPVLYATSFAESSQNPVEQVILLLSLYR